MAYLSKKQKEDEDDVKNIYEKDNEDIMHRVNEMEVKGVPTVQHPVPSARQHSIKLPEVLLEIWKDVAGGKRSLDKLAQPAVDRTDMLLKSSVLLLAKIYEEMKNKKG